jgi:hypothetical protein
VVEYTEDTSTDQRPKENTVTAITEQERDEARRILDTDNGGAGLDVHMRSYFTMVANWPADAVPVRSETGGIVGYTLQSVTALIERLMDEERGHLDLADAATEPELAGAHRAIAQNYRLARMTRETDQAYTAQTFKLAAVGWEDLMPDALRLVYMGKSSGLWPHQRAEKDAAEIETTNDWLLVKAQKDVTERKHREVLTARAKTMTDAELGEAITAAKTAPAGDFLILVRERDARQKATRKALNAKASGTPWTDAEERMLKATEAQTADMADAKLREFYARPYSTRRQELQREAVRREMERRGI